MRQVVYWLVLTAGMLAGSAGCAEMKAPMETGQFAGSAMADTARPAAPVAALAAPAEPVDAPPQSLALMDADGTTQPAANVQRIMVYTANLRMVVRDVRGTQISIQKLAESQGGYLQELAQDAIVVRIPAARFQDVVGQTEKLGEVTQRALKALDVTEEMHDLHIRLDNAEKTRQRLQALLDKMQKTEDLLKAEQELQRITETIELLKGKIQYWSSQAAFSTLRVELNSPLPQKQMVAQIPFAWVRELGSGLVAGVAEASPDVSRWERRGTHFDLPKSYIRYYERDQVTEAMSADGMLIKLQRQENYKGGDLDFWAALSRRALVENRAVALEKTYDISLKTGATARLFVGTKDMGGKSYGYLLAVVANEKRVYALEAWGPADIFNRDLKSIQESLTTLEVNK